MKYIDKKNIFASLSSAKNYDSIKLELGCGKRKRISDAIGIDMLDHECVDIVGDIFDVLKVFPSNSVTAIYSFHFLEHIADIDLIVGEVTRILKENGELQIVVPHFSNPYFYSDSTHKTFFGLYSLSYFAKDSIFKRSVPTYNRQIQLELMNVELVFKSPPGFFIRNRIKKILEKIFNLNSYMKELYEENFCYIFPCYEIRFQLKKSK